jgi:hypothetical protein
MYPLAILSATAIVGIIIDNLIVVVLPLIVLVLFPGLPLFFHLVMHFHDLSRDGWQAVMEEVKIHNPNIAYLMRKSEYNNLFRLTN